MSQRADAPILFVMLSQPSDNMMKWVWATLRSLPNPIKSTDVSVLYLLDAPPSGAKGRPTKEELRLNWPRFYSEMRQMASKVIVPFGSEALHAVSGCRVAIDDARGYVVPPALRGRLAHDVWQQYTTYKTSNEARGYKKGDPRCKWMTIDADPALPPGFSGVIIPSVTLDYVRKDSFACTAALKCDMDRVARAAEGQIDVLNEAWVYSRDLTGTSSTDYVGDILAFDIETPKDSPNIERISFSNGNRTHTLAWNEETRVWSLRQINLAVERGATLVLHNAPFDIPRLALAGCPVSEDAILYDTMLAGVVLQPDLPKGLGRMAPLYLDVWPFKKQWETWLGIDEELYSATDSYVTANLALVQMPMLKSMGMWDLFMGGGKHPGPGQMPTVRTLMQASADGLKLDRMWTEKWCVQLREQLVGLHKSWSDLVPGVNPMSTKDLRRLFYSEWRLPIPKTRDDSISSISTDELAVMKMRRIVEEVAHEDTRCTPEVFDLLLAIRAAGKNLKTYAAPGIDMGDGYVHPSYLPEAKDHETKDGAKRKGNTATGRLAASYPNIANQPKEARYMYIPDHPGLCFVQGDYKSAELFVLAYLSGDRVLQDDLTGDIHTRNAERLKTDRRTAKNILYALWYHAGAAKISDMILRQQHFFVPVAECARIQQGLMSIYSVAVAYRRAIGDQCMNEQYLRNPFGRVRMFYDRNIPAAANFNPQSTVADILLCVLKPVAERVRALGGRFTTSVYDSILVQVPEPQLPACLNSMRTIMEQQFDNVAPGFYLPVAFQVGAPGASWAELKDVPC